MFARRIDDDAVALLMDDGTAATRQLREWPTLWPEGSDVSARYEHPEGIVLSNEEFANIADRIELKHADEAARAARVAGYSISEMDNGSE
jgi:hypothetical protein